MTRPRLGNTGPFLGRLHPRFHDGDPILGTPLRFLREAFGLMRMLLGENGVVAGLLQRRPEEAILVANMSLGPAQAACGRVNEIDQPAPCLWNRLRCGCRRNDTALRVGPLVGRVDQVKADQVGTPRAGLLRRRLYVVHDALLTPTHNRNSSLEW